MTAIETAYRILIEERRWHEFSGDREAASACTNAIAALAMHPTIKARRDAALDALMAETGHLE